MNFPPQVHPLLNETKGQAGLPAINGLVWAYHSSLDGLPEMEQGIGIGD
jgi:hypothetical protein